jgi:hypothetical protein
MTATSSNATCIAISLLVTSASATFAQGLAGDISAVAKGAELAAKGALLGGAQLQAVKSSSNASVKLSRVQSLGAGTSYATFNAWSLTAAAPLNKTADDTTIANLDGLTNAASIEFGFSRFVAQGKRQATHVASKTAELDVICKRVFQARKVRDGTDAPEKIEGCDSNLVATYGSEEDKHAFESSFWDIGHSNRWLWGGSAKLGFQDFEYVTTTESAKQKRNETPWSLGLWGAVQPGDRQLLLSATVQYQRSFKEGNSATICPVPTSNATSVSCITGPFESPKQVTKKLLTLEVRARPSDVGIALAVTRDFETKVTGVELPAYFVADKDSKLTAGLKAGWRSDSKKGTVGLFVGVPFGLYK